MVAGLDNFSALKALPDTGVQWLSDEQKKYGVSGKNLLFPLSKMKSGNTLLYVH